MIRFAYTASFHSTYPPRVLVFQGKKRNSRYRLTLTYQMISKDSKQHKNENYTLIGDTEHNNQLGYFDEPLPCCGCGIGWFCMLFGFLFPLLWYYATILYLRNYYQKDPRERTGLAASAIAALIFTIAVLIAIVVIFL